MAIIKCKMCGGDIVLSEDKTYGTCEYCGSTMTFPKVSDEQKLNLFNRANHFRRQNEFDKAIAAYEKILEQDETDAEAHWGAVLSRYGIEYVEDPVTHERIPTCHRVQLQSILTDGDYLDAVKHAPDTASRDIYEKEARRIADIQKGILAISSQEKPYDVFICYKESDDSGSRTVDSTLAQEIYYQLTNEGYKVFFSRITLEDKLGQEYEPYIFAALNSAKVMLVVGTRPENFNAVWVKNEWSRYLDLMKSDRSKLLIPCYRDMDPYDLPEALSALQSQDMSKIGFMQDLIRGVKKVLGTEKEIKPAVVAPGVASLHKRAVLFLEDGDWEQANEYFDRILDIDPEYAPAYIGKVQATLKVRKEDALSKYIQPLKGNPDYQKAVRFADEQHKAIYEGYNRAIEERIVLEHKEAAYREAEALEKRAAVEADFLNAAKKYDDAGEIRDAKTRAADCRAKAAAAKQAAERQAEEYRKQLEQEREERRRKEEEARLEAERKAEQKRKEAEERAEQQRLERERRERDARIAAERQKKRNRTIAVVLVVLALIGAGGFAGYKYVYQPKQQYAAAQELLNAEDYVGAAEAFTALGGYSDSAEKVKEAYYAHAVSLYDEGEDAAARDAFLLADDYADAAARAKQIEDYGAALAAFNQWEYQTARPLFQTLGDYRDSADKLDIINEFLYEDATERMQAGDIAGAYEIYSDISDYSDSAEIVAKIDSDYQSAAKLMEEKRYDEASAAFAALKNYSDSAEKASASLYQKAEALLSDGDYDAAAAQFRQLGDYSDSADRAGDAIYQKAEARYADGDFEEAIAVFETIENYGDSNSRARAIRYEMAEKLWAEGNLQDAAEAYKTLGEYSDAPQKLQQISAEIAETALSESNYADALTAYQRLEQTDEIKAKEYELAQTCYEEGHFAEATSAYETLGQYELSLSKLPIARYAWADQLFNAGDYAGAQRQFAILGDMTDSAQRAKESAYQLGKQKLEAGDYDYAWLTFTSISGYGDADELAMECKYRQADELFDAGNYSAAQTAYEALGDYSDSAERVKVCIYSRAEELFAAEDYINAQALYASLEYKDSSEKAILCTYKQADELFATGEYMQAEALYGTISDYEDSADKIKNCRLQQGKALMDSGDYTTALTFFDGLEYSDSVDLEAQCYYQLGRKAQIEGVPDEAVENYAYATELAEAREALLSIGKDYAAINEAEKTIQTLWLIRDDEAAASILAELCDLKARSGETGIALLAWCALGNNEATALQDYVSADGYALLDGQLEHSTILPEDLHFQDAMLYEFAVIAMDHGDYDLASTVFDAVGNYEDALELAKESQYRKATSLKDAGEYGQAYAVYATLTGYRDVGSIIVNDDNIAAVAYLAQFEVNNTFTFGHFEQDNNTSNGAEAIEWIVLANDGHTATLISKYGLDAKQYNMEYESVTWESCTLRKWLNGDFLNAAFSAEEQARLETVTVTADKNPKYDTNPGNDTQDKVYLLSIDEVNALFSSDDARKCQATEYAKVQGVYVGDSGNCWWWLRSPGLNSHDAVYVTSDGSVRNSGSTVDNDHYVIRPVMVLRLL